MYRKFVVDVGGENVTNFIYPAVGKPKATVLFCHGFPGTNRLPKLKNALTEVGIEIIEINYRGDKASAGKFSFIGSIEDVTKTAEQLRKTRGKLIGLGLSMGGFYIANAIRNKPGLFDKALLAIPILDSAELFANPVMGGLWNVARETISLESKEFYEKEMKLVVGKYDPIKFAKELRTPIHLIAAEKDDYNSVGTAMRFFSELEGEKQLTAIKDAGHDLDGTEKELIDAITA